MQNMLFREGIVYAYTVQYLQTKSIRKNHREKQHKTLTVYQVNYQIYNHNRIKIGKWTKIIVVVAFAGFPVIQ